MTGAADAMMDFPAGTIFSPYQVLRNISDEPISIKPKLFWMQGGASKAAALRRKPESCYAATSPGTKQPWAVRSAHSDLNHIGALFPFLRRQGGS